MISFMLLEPGPLPPISTSWYQGAILLPDFSDMVSVFWQQGDQVLIQMDSWVDPAGVIADELDDEGMGAQLQALDDQNAQNWAGIQLVGMANLDKAHDDSATYLSQAVQFMPGEAWVAPQAADFARVPLAAPTTAQIISVTLLDQTNPPGPPYFTNDSYQIQVKMSTTTGAIADYLNVAVSAVLTHDNGPPITLQLGATDTTGLVTYDGGWGISDYGAWSMVIHAAPRSGGEVLASGYQWTVAPSTHPVHGPMTPAVTVTLTNTTSGVSTYNHVGDSWTLVVTGPPSAPVYVWAVHDATTLPEVQLGDTLANGTLTLYGAWADADAGLWTEHYRVSSFVASQALSFTVLKAAPVIPGPGGILPP